MSDHADRPAANLRAVAFDFDGVILESGLIKQRAFLALFADRPDLQPAILAHHREHLGVSRYDKLAWIHRELLGRPLSAAELAEEGRRYSALVLEEVLSCPSVPGAEDLLRSLAPRIPCFVVSATPQEELELIVARRGLAGYFRELHGAPAAKADVLADLMRRHGLSRNELLMVGDGFSDYKAANLAGVPFVLRETAEQEEQFRLIEVDRVPDMTALGSWLDSRLTPETTAARTMQPAGTVPDTETR